MASKDGPSGERNSSPIPFGQQEQGYSRETSRLVMSGRYDPLDGDPEEDEQYVVIQGEPGKPATIRAKWKIKRSQLLVLNLQKPWTKKTKLDKLQITVKLLPDIRCTKPDESVLLLVSAKILKNRLPELKYEAHTTIQLCSGAEVLMETPQGEHRFKDGKDDVNFTMEVASQEAVEKTASSELSLSVEVQLHELTRGDVTFNNVDGHDFMMVDLPKDD